MDLQYGSEARNAFATNVGLIISNGPHGNNIMAAEWAYQISYDPPLMEVSIGAGKATYENIEASKEFGICIASIHQNAVASVAGGSSGKNVNKIGALEDMGFIFNKAQSIDALLIDDSSLHLECILKDTVKRGDHTIFIGEAIHIEYFEQNPPLIYHKGSYWNIGQPLTKPSDDERHAMKAFVEKHTK